MAFDPMPDHLTGVLHPGMMHNRWDRPVKNGHWYWAGPDSIRNVGWGDVSFADLDAVSETLRDGDVFVVLPERAVHLVAPPEPATASSLVEHAVYAVTPGRVLYVDHHHRANRQGAVWIRPGYRLANTGRTIRRRARRVLTTRPEELLESLEHRGAPGTPPTPGTP
jgi:hypothetical protein